MRRVAFSSCVAATAARAFTTFPELTKPANGPASLPKLSFDYREGCQPVFTPRQLELHYTKHHKAYVDKLNALAKSDYDGLTIEDIAKKTADDATKKVLFNQAAQHFNHTFFWNCVTPNGAAISEAFKKAIAADFGSFEAFVAAFEDRGVSNFGSGWTWLVYNPSTKKLELDNTSNAGAPFTKGLVPLLTVDVWEHAYYKDFENRRADFLKEYWKIVNWGFVEAQWKRATQV